MIAISAKDHQISEKVICKMPQRKPSFNYPEVSMA